MSDISTEELDGLLKQYNHLEESIWFYDHTEELKFNRKTWTWYRVNGGTLERLYGVTGVVHIIDKSAPLMAWCKKRCMEKLRRLMVERAGSGSEDALMQLYIGTLDEIIKEAKRADEEEKDAACDTGHDAHEWIEQYVKATLRHDEARREELLAKFPQDERAANCCIGMLTWSANHNVRWISTERPVYSRKHKCVGTMDGLALVDGCDDRLCCSSSFKDRLSVIDWKTSNALYIEYLFQTACYQSNYEEETGETIEDRWVIRLGKEDAEFDPWHVEGRESFEQDWRGYYNALQLFISVHEVEDRIDGVKNVRRAVLKERARAAKEAEHRVRCPKADDYKGIRRSKCFEDGTQCQACTKIYEEKHHESTNRTAGKVQREVHTNDGTETPDRG